MFNKIKIVDVIQIGVFLGLCIVATFFMQEVIKQFVSKDTSLKQSEINITQYPVVTICMKGNVSFEYGPDFIISLGDFKLQLGDDEYEVYDSEYDYYEDETSQSLVYSLQKIHSYITGYPCYRVMQTGYDLIRSGPAYLYVNFFGSNTKGNLPDIEVYFTSVKNSDGIIFSEWMDGNELKFTFLKVSTKWYYGLCIRSSDSELESFHFYITIGKMDQK